MNHVNHREDAEDFSKTVLYFDFSPSFFRRAISSYCVWPIVFLESKEMSKKERLRLSLFFPPIGWD